MCGTGSKKPRLATSPLTVNNDIYLLRDGTEMGPFSEEKAHSFLKQGGILHDDLAWTPGMAAWAPLSQLLQQSSSSNAQSALPVAAKYSGDPATPKQKAFLSYIAIPFSSDTTKEQAALLVNEAMEDPKLNARVLQWNDDRLTLHPDLFAAEAQEKKERRANHFFESCQKEGAERLAGVTKAHCQVLVGYLDVNFPNWDANESEAAWDYFFPAVAEKFPQLVRKPWRGKLKYPDGPRVAPELAQHAHAIAPHSRRSPVAALVRGMAVGLALLLVAYVAIQMLPRDNAAATPSAPAPAPVIAPEPQKTIREKPVEPPADPAPQDIGRAENTPPAEPPPSEPAPSETLPAPAVTAPKTMLVITKATSVLTQYGLVKLTVGQQLKIISRDDAKVKARHLNEIVEIPIGATDLAAQAPAQ